MLDVVELKDGEDVVFIDTVVKKAGNIIRTQIGSLEYAPNLGVDLKFFLQSSLQFQNLSFKAHLVERLAQQQVNVTQVIDVIEKFTENYTFKVGDSDEELKGFIV